jgi:hypothetical protein
MSLGKASDRQGIKSRVVRGESNEGLPRNAYSEVEESNQKERNKNKIYRLDESRNERQWYKNKNSE